MKNINLKTSILEKNKRINRKKFGLIKYYALSLHPLYGKANVLKSTKEVSKIAT
jgi:hypothetical protein